MTFSFSDLLAAAPVTLDLAATEADVAIHDVIRQLEGNPNVVDANRFATQVLEREKLSPTAMGHGVAFPHARTDAVREILMAVGRSKPGIVFPGASDGAVHFLFVIGTPPDRVPQYLALVGRLARALKSDTVRERLLNAADAAAFRSALGEG